MTPRRERVATRRNRIARRTIAVVSPLPPPEEVFIDWLMSVPADDCLEAAARFQIEIIDRRALTHPDIRYLRALLVAVAGDCSWRNSCRFLRKSL